MFPKIMRLIFVLLYTSFIVAGSYLGSNSDEFEPNYYYQDDYEGPDYLNNGDRTDKKIFSLAVLHEHSFFVCSTTLFTVRHALTIAIGVSEYLPDRFEDLYLSRGCVFSSRESMKYQVSNIQLQYEGQPEILKKSLAVVTLKKRIECDTHLMPISLTDKEFSPDQSKKVNAEALGWSRFYEVRKDIIDKIFIDNNTIGAYLFEGTHSERNIIAIHKVYYLGGHISIDGKLVGIANPYYNYPPEYNLNMAFLKIRPHIKFIYEAMKWNRNLKVKKFVTKKKH